MWRQNAKEKIRMEACCEGGWESYIQGISKTLTSQQSLLDACRVCLLLKKYEERESSRECIGHKRSTYLSSAAARELE
jgi:hypothetical protein